MTDERMGEALWHALARLPRGSGVVFRHDTLPRPDRLRLGRKVSAVARRRGLVLAVAGDMRLAAMLNAALVHRPRSHPGGLPHSLPVHDVAQAIEARRSRADLVFVSPLFATRSHPDRAALGAKQGVSLARKSGAKAIALGGMNEKRWRPLRPHFYGYAGIDCWIRT
jgi:thiamine-phosphate pyrophosphorylase